MADRRTAYLYTSHLLTPGTLSTYLRIRKAARSSDDVFWVGDGKRLCNRLTRLGIQVFPVSKELLDTWSASMNGNGLIPGNCHIPMLAFSRTRSYDQYWFIEYDVQYTGSWQSLFSLTESSDADLLATEVTVPFKDETWNQWSTIDLPYERVARSYNPFYRVSHRVLDRVSALTSDGYWAHNEVLLATICHHNGWAVEDLNDLAQRNWGCPIYNIDTFTYRPVLPTSAGCPPSTLYHPVKPLTWYYQRRGVGGLARGVKDLIRRYATFIRRNP